MAAVGGGHPSQEQVERVHEEVAQFGPLDYGVGADQVGPGADDDDAVLWGVGVGLGLGLSLLARRYQAAEVVEFAGAVGVGEDDVFAPRVAHAVRDGAAFAAVVLQRYEADATRWYVDGVVGAGGPWSGVATWAERE